MTPPIARLLALLATGALVGAGCTGSEESGGDTDQSATAVSSGDTVARTASAVTTASEETAVLDTAPAESPSDTEAPDTAAPATETPATEALVETSEAPTAPILRATGIGPLDFGSAAPADVEGLLAPLFGSASSVVSTQYSDDTGTYYENSLEESAFSYPYGITYCYQNELCVFFGGANANSATFVGYRQSEHRDSLTTISGVTAGSAGADFADVLVTEAGGCYTTGGGTADGVPLFLSSSGEPFSVYEPDDAIFTNNAPPAADVTVIDVFAGEEPFFLYDDC